jgi:putative membrane protein
MNSDPRVFFASERTLLAWLRTGIAIVGLGFLVSRFGLFVHLMAAQSGIAHPGVDSGYSHFIGVVFVALGALSMVAATVQHGRFIRTLPEIDRPAAYSRAWALWLAGLVSLASLALAVYLALAPQ